LLVDSHCHLQDRKFGREIAEVVARARDGGVTAMVTIGYDMPSSRRAIEIADEFDDVYATIGVHPHDAKTLTEGDLEELERMAEADKVVAIGEIGLDFYRRLSPREDQARAFQWQLDLARRVHKPVVIHSRDADEETFAVLERYANDVRLDGHMDGAIGVMHTFAGDLPLAQRYIEIGCVISLSGTVTYPAAEKTREVARGIPLRWMAVETDSPYLPPQPIRGQRNEPARARDIAEYVAELRGETAADVMNGTAQTAQRLFALGNFESPATAN
jgi:TatD DNase family protein